MPNSSRRFQPMRKVGERHQKEEDEPEIPTVPEEEEVNRLLAMRDGEGGDVEEEEQEAEEEEKVEQDGDHTTRSGTPDRRFKGQRDLPAPTLRYSYRSARTGGVHGGTHVTMSGKPDRRFKENRNMDEEDVMKRYAMDLAEQYGIH